MKFEYQRKAKAGTRSEVRGMRLEGSAASEKYSSGGPSLHLSGREEGESLTTEDIEHTEGNQSKTAQALKGKFSGSFNVPGRVKSGRNANYGSERRTVETKEWSDPVRFECVAYETRITVRGRTGRIKILPA